VGVTIVAAALINLKAVIRVGGSIVKTYGRGAYTTSTGEVLASLNGETMLSLTSGNTVDIAIVNGSSTARNTEGDATRVFCSFNGPF
jgi:hypothetical protein